MSTPLLKKYNTIIYEIDGQLIIINDISNLIVASVA